MSPLSIARSTRHALVIPLLLAALAAPALPRASLAAPAQATMRTITITSSRVAFPKSIPAGMLALRVVTDAQSGLYSGFARVNRGATIAEVEAAQAKGDFLRLTQILTFLGGVGVPPRSTGTVVLDLRTPGQYGMHVVRSVDDPGRDLLFTVTPSGAREAAPPRAEVSVTLAGTRFVGLPTTLPAGATTFKVTNSSSWVRDMKLFRVDPGKTVQDMIAAVKVAEQTHQNPTWAHRAGGVALLSPHQTAWVTLDFTPGTYVAFCPLSDPQKGGEPFALEGMIASFTVS